MLLVPFPSDDFHQILLLKFSHVTTKAIPLSLKTDVFRQILNFPFGKYVVPSSIVLAP